MKKIILLLFTFFTVQQVYATDPLHGLRVYGMLGFGTFGNLQLGGGVGYTATFNNPTKTDIPIAHQLTTDSQLIVTLFDLSLQWNTFTTYGLELALPKNVFLTIDFLGLGIGLNTPFNDIGFSFITVLPGLQISYGQLYFAWRNQYVSTFGSIGSEYKTYFAVGWELSKYLPTKNTRYNKQYQ